MGSVKGRGLLTSSSALGLATVVASLLIGCQKNNSHSEPTGENLVTNENKLVERSIGDALNQFQVLGTKALEKKISDKSVLEATSDLAKKRLNQLAKINVTTKPKPTTGKLDGPLVLGFPVSLLNENQVFGAAITKVTDSKNDNVGMLRLASLPPIHVKTVVAKNSDGSYLFALLGCPTRCSEGMTPKAVLTIPIVGVDLEKDTVLVDLSSVGSELNLAKMVDPMGEQTKLTSKSSEVVTFDYSLSTLVFDIETKMVPIVTGFQNDVPVETTFTARWYLRLTSAFDPAFKPREATRGIGYFLTQRSDAPKIQRFGKPTLEGGVKYYIKNVPSEYRSSFSASFDEWNTRFVETTGKKLLSYEFLETTDPRYKLITAGDVRYNVVEWDIDNMAPYGGYGPSIANQFTGEIFSANVLVQGPKIVKGYKKWFEALQKSQSLKQDGYLTRAEQQLRDVSTELAQDDDVLKRTTFGLTLGDELNFDIGTQSSDLEDPAFARGDFDLTPAGSTYEKYIDGYFRDMIEHELGHNLGLRHNFRGNLSAKDVPEIGGVSHSVMEYLGKESRHLDRIGPYDVMAIKFGYLGTLPTRTDMYCTDQEVGSVNNPEGSAECSKDDATNDPFNYFEGRLTKAIDLLVAKDAKEGPAWTVEDMQLPLSTAILGLGLYASSAESSSRTWTNFNKVSERPKKADEIALYVRDKIYKQICNPLLEQTAAMKSSEVQVKVQTNLKTLRSKTKALLGLLDTFEEYELECPTH